VTSDPLEEGLFWFGRKGYRGHEVELRRVRFGRAIQIGTIKGFGGFHLLTDVTHRPEGLAGKQAQFARTFGTFRVR
jgi:hypothetical protein